MVVDCGPYLFVFFFKQKTAYEMRISDWSSDVCSSDLPGRKSSLPKQPGVLAPSARLSAPWSWIDAGDSAKTCSASIDPAFPAPPDARRIVSAPGNRDRLYLQQYDALAAKLSAQADRKSTRLNSSH